MINICVKKVLVVGIIVLLISVVTISTGSADTDNYPPAPPTIEGPTAGKPGVAYDSTFNSVDLDGHNISYYIDWGDGTCDGWTDYFNSGLDITFSHTYEDINWDNTIRAKAKDIYGKESDWSIRVIPILENIENSISSPIKMLFEHGAESEDSDELEPLDQYIEIISKVSGSGYEYSRPGFFGLNIVDGDGVNIKSLTLYNGIITVEHVDSVYASFFIGLRYAIANYWINFAGWAFGNIEWERYI